MTTWSLLDGASGRPGVGSSGTQPPASGTAFSGGYLAGMVFGVTQGALFLTGYRWWVANSGQDTAAQKFALWNLTNNSGVFAASNLAVGTVTSGALTAGQFNTVTLAAPVALTPNIPYLAVTGGTLTHGFPDTTNQFGASQPYASGITNGPLMCWSSLGGSNPLGSVAQNPFSTGSSDPAASYPTSNNANDILWIDVIVSDQVPPGSTYRAWPNMVPYTAGVALNSGDTTGYTLGMQFYLTQACSLDRIWHYSPPGVAALPTRCGIWDVNSQTEVSGTDNSSPTWSGAAGSGWVSCDYTSANVTLNASQQYKVFTFHAAGSTWFGAQANVFGAGNLQGSGITNGPLVIPNNAASSPGQQSWNIATFGYPTTSSNPEADYIDVEVTPQSAPASPPQYVYQMRRFP